MKSDLEVQYQHYVSQFYLTGWQATINSKPRRIWIYEKNEQPRHKPIKRAAGDYNFNGIKNFGKKLDVVTVEDFLKKIETRAGRVISKIINKQPINKIEKNHIAVFLVVSSLRSPARKADTEKFLLESLSAYMMPFRLTAFSMQLKKRGKALNNVIKAENWFRDNPDSLFAITITNEQSIQKLAHEIERMDWGFLYTNSSELVTCDNPCIYSRDCGIKNYRYGHVIFPISKNVSLQISNSTRFNGSYIKISDDLVSEINERIIKNAYNQVYASHKSERLKYNVQNYLGADL